MSLEESFTLAGLSFKTRTCKYLKHRCLMIKTEFRFKGCYFKNAVVGVRLLRAKSRNMLILFYILDVQLYFSFC